MGEPDRPDRWVAPDLDPLERPEHTRDSMAFPGIIELTLSGRGPRRGFLFDPHRLALPCWALAVASEPALLVTFDRHFDLVPPRVLPPRGASPAQLDEYARTTLDERNVDHIFAAMEAGLVSDVIAVARAWPQGAVREDRWRTSDGREHRILRAPTLERLLETPAALEALTRASQTLLDVDLDCFVTPSDADPFTVIPWPKTVIREFLRAREARPFWDEVLGRCRGLTIAREPNHCGGVIASNRLFETAAEVLFGELLETDLP